MAQVFADVIIQNTGSGKGDHFWDNDEPAESPGSLVGIRLLEARNIGQADGC